MTENISPHEAYAKITRGDAYGVDVREYDEWTAGHAAKAIWNPLTQFNGAALPSDKPLIFICRSGNRSSRVCQALTTTRSDISNMLGGMQAWHAAGLPMVSDQGEPRVA
jgi:rhodanese-related sulfurtransferase